MALTQITAAELHTLNTVVNDKFIEGYAKAKDSPIEILTMHTSGVGESVSFPFLAQFPTIRELLGESKFSQLVDSMYQIKNKEYQSGVEIKTIDLARRNTALYAPIVSQAGKQARLGPGRIALRMFVENAFNPNSKDFTGTAFISDNKPFFAKPEGYKGKYPEGRWSNKGTGKLNTETLSAAIANIQERQDMNGDYLNLGMGNFILAVSPKNGTYAKMIVKQRAHYASNDSPLFGEVSVMPIAGIKDNQWFLFDADDDVKPIIINEELPFSILTNAANPNDSEIIKTQKVYYSVYGSYGIGWGSSFHAYGSTGTTGELDKFPSQA